jgi:PAS domain S-box-containing protein
VAGDGRTGEPPDEPADEFYRRVLDQMPTPIVVVDSEGRIVYGNAYMSSSIRTSLDAASGRHLFEFVHPDDLGWAAEAFLALVEAGRVNEPWVEEPWTPVPMRVVDAQGNPLHVEVTGAHSVRDGRSTGSSTRSATRSATARNRICCARC